MTTQCSICLDTIDENTTNRALNCGHIYHFQCINTWIKHNSICPLCKSYIPENITVFTQKGWPFRKKINLHISNTYLILKNRLIINKNIKQLRYKPRRIDIIINSDLKIRIYSKDAYTIFNKIKMVLNNLKPN
jgi:hypothetical protein